MEKPDYKLENEITVVVTVEIKHTYNQNKTYLTHQQIADKVYSLVEEQRNELAMAMRIATIDILDGDEGDYDTKYDG